MNAIDFQKLLKQEPDFAEFTKTVLLDSFSKTNQDIIQIIHNFYMIGVTTKQATDFIINANRQGKDPE